MLQSRKKRLSMKELVYEQKLEVRERSIRTFCCEQIFYFLKKYKLWFLITQLQYNAPVHVRAEQHLSKIVPNTGEQRLSEQSVLFC